MKYTNKHLELFLFVLIVFNFVFPVNGCTLVYGTRAQITIFDFEGNKVGNKNLKYLGVDVDCTLKNLVLPEQKNKIYVEDNQGILSLVDLTEGKWKILKNFDLNGVPVTNWHSSTIYQNKCLTVRSLVNEKVKIHVFDLEKQDSEYLTFDPYWELMNQGKINYSIVDIFRVALNQNWGACLSLINQSSQATPNSSLQELWVYKYNFNTGEGQSIFQTDFLDEFTDNCQFKISDNGNFAFFDQVIESNQSYRSPRYALKDAYLIDFQNQSISRGCLGVNVGQSWIEDKYLYYTNSPIEISDDKPLELYLKKYDISTQENETITETGIWSQFIFVLADYIILFHLGRSQSTPSNLLVIILFIIIGLSFIIFTMRRFIVSHS